MDLHDDLLRVPNPFIPFLISTRVRDICPRIKVLTIDADTPVKQFSQKLRVAPVQSFPVLKGKNQECVGIVDVIDESAFLLRHSSSENLSEILETYTVENMMLYTQTNPFLPVFAYTSLHDVISIVAPGVHRAVVLESEDNHQVHSICSESDLVAALYCYSQKDIHNYALRMITTLPVHGFSNYSSLLHHVIYADQTMEDAIEALQRSMVSTASISSTSTSVTHFYAPFVAVIDRTTNPEKPQVIGHFDTSILSPSIKQTKETGTEVIKKFSSPVKEFTAKMGWFVPHTIKFYDLLKLFIEHQLRHVWVLKDDAFQQTNQHNIYQYDIDQQLVSVITLGDILRWVSRDNLWLMKDVIRQFGQIPQDIPIPSSPSSPMPTVQSMATAPGSLSSSPLSSVDNTPI